MSRILPSRLVRGGGWCCLGLMKLERGRAVCAKSGFVMNVNAVRHIQKLGMSVLRGVRKRQPRVDPGGVECEFRSAQTLALCEEARREDCLSGRPHPRRPAGWRMPGADEVACCKYV